MTATHRHPAILAVGVVGYSRLSCREEARTPASVRERREVARPVDVDAALANDLVSHHKRRSWQPTTGVQ
jgi:hypothetical protein